jgi:hypothetical protein
MMAAKMVWIGQERRLTSFEIRRLIIRMFCWADIVYMTVL